MPDKKDALQEPQSDAEAPKCITLEGVGDGAAPELFAAALGDVLKNLADVNTPWKAKRRVVLEFEFTTNEDRNPVDLTISCSTKLAGLTGISTLVHVGQHKGKLLAVESPRQTDLFPTPNAHPIPFPPAEED